MNVSPDIFNLDKIDPKSQVEIIGKQKLDSSPSVDNPYSKCSSYF
jgi:hypothetical protein